LTHISCNGVMVRVDTLNFTLCIDIGLKFSVDISCLARNLCRHVHRERCDRNKLGVIDFGRAQKIRCADHMKIPLQHFF